MDCTLDTYIDYLLATTTSATATGMSTLMAGEISHDKVTRFLSDSYLDSSMIWSRAKPLVRRYEDEKESVLIADDTIIEKAHTDENAMICWHWDHSLGRMVKGVNLLSLLFHGGEVSIPVNVHLIEKTEGYVDATTGATKYRSPLTKNEITRAMLRLAKSQQIEYRYFLGDSWFSSAETMNFVQDDLSKHYIMAVESSRTVALCQKDKLNGVFHRLDSLSYPEDGSPQRVYLRSVTHEVLLVRQVFTNKDGSQGILSLVSNDIELDGPSMTAIYKKRWNVEEYHKSLKQHTAVAKSPTKTIQTQANHMYASLAAYIKLETIKLKHGIGHFAIRTILVAAATKAAFIALGQILA
ncbi:MAG: transposase [Candidatus Kapaibacterium sp.]